jgi:hypothetical protein
MEMGSAATADRAAARMLTNRQHLKWFNPPGMQRVQGSPRDRPRGPAASRRSPFDSAVQPLRGWRRRVLSD